MEAAERAKQNLRSLTCSHPSRREQWRDNDWFKTRAPDQTPSRPRFIQSVSDLCRPRSLDPTRTNSIQVSSQWVGRRPMSNSVENPLLDLDSSPARNLVYGSDGDLVAEFAKGSRQHLGTFLLFSGT